MKYPVVPNPSEVYSPSLDVSDVPPLGSYVARQCPVRVQWRCNPPTEIDVAPPTPMLRHRFRAGNKFEREILSPLGDAEPVRDLVVATLEAMRSGVLMIAGGELPPDLHGRRVGRPDLLIRCTSLNSASGLPAYWPVDIKHHQVLGSTRGEPAYWSRLDHPFVEDAELVVGRFDVNSKPRRADLLQLAHYWRMLEASGHSPSGGGAETWAGVLGTDVPGIVWTDLNRPRFKSDGSIERDDVESALRLYDFEFSHRLDIAATTLLHRKITTIPLLVEPVRCRECETCKWQVECDRTLTAGSGDVSLLPGVGRRQWAALRDLGFRTRGDLAVLDPTTARLSDGFSGSSLASTVARAKQGHPPATPIEAALPPRATGQIRIFRDNGLATVADLNRIDDRTMALHGHVRNAADLIDLAWMATRGGGAPHRRRGVDSTAVGRADIEIDVDAENDMNGATYLWGTYLTNLSGREFAYGPGYLPFVQWKPVTDRFEATVFNRFWLWLWRVILEASRQGLTSMVYSWHESAELSQMKRAARRMHPTRVSGMLVDIDALQNRSGHWTDVEREFKRVAVSPSGTKLKYVAQFAGANWEADDADGESSMLWHLHASSGDKEMRAKLLRYNEDDVAAGPLIRDWLCGNELPSLPE